MMQKVRSFFSEVQIELGKVTWPTREELVSSTGVVLMTMFILSLFIGIFDFIFSFMMRLLLR